MTTDNNSTDIKSALLDAIKMHVVFDGWSDQSFGAACQDINVDPAAARAICPRGAVDLAIAYHEEGDAAMVSALSATDLSEMRFRDRVSFAVKKRLELVDDREAVRRGTVLFSLPHLAGDGAKLVWGTCDKIWTALGDTSDDYNWYTKRATLSGVYSSTVLFWLGDDSPDHQSTWDFLDRRIDNVMQFEKVKAQVNNSPLLRPFMAGPNFLLSKIKPPRREAADDLPGHVTPGHAGTS